MIDLELSSTSTSSTKPDDLNVTVSFRVDANTKIGGGHFMRCIALAHGFVNGGARCLFLVERETLKFVEQLESFSFPLEVYDLGCENEIDWIDKICVKMASRVVVLDGYQFNANFRQALSGLDALLVVIDDDNSNGELFADFIVNPVSRAVKLGYEHTSPRAKLLLGPNYTLLRPEFTSISSGHLHREYAEREDLLISFGASDVGNMTIPLLEKILSSRRGVEPVTVVTGAAYLRKESLVSLIEEVGDHSGLVTHLHQVNNMATVMKNAKMAVSAAGGTVFELAAMGVPTILLVVADNQLNAALEQQSMGWCRVIDAREAFSCDSLMQQIEVIWNDDAMRVRMSRIALENAVTGGADRVANEILQVLSQSELDNVDA